MAMTEVASSSSSAILCLLLLSFPYGEISMLVSAHMITQQSFSPAIITWTTWCVAKPSADKEALRNSMDYACGQTDCTLARAGGICFLPETLAHHTSFAMNSYYRSMGARSRDCYFNNTALVALTDPSYGSCHFFESQSRPPKGTVERKDTWCVAKPGAPEKILKANIRYVCRELKDCNVIRKRGSCFFPRTTMNHASVVMNLYYKTRGRYDCDFNNTGLIVMTSPNYGKCIYV